MTSSLSDLSTRIVNFDNRIQYFKQEAKTIASAEGHYSEEDFNTIKSEYAQLVVEKKSLKQEIQKIKEVGAKQFLNSPLWTAVFQRFFSSKDSCKHLKGKLNSSYAVNVTDGKLNDLIDQFFKAAIPSNIDSLIVMDDLQKRSLEIISEVNSSDYYLSPSAFEKATTLQNSIDDFQKAMISKQLKELHRLVGLSIDNSIEKKQYIAKMIHLMHVDLPACELGCEVRSYILTEVRNEIVRNWGIDPDNIPQAYNYDYSKTVPVFEHLPILSQIISKHPLFLGTYDWESLPLDSIPSRDEDNNSEERIEKTKIQSPDTINVTIVPLHLSTASNEDNTMPALKPDPILPASNLDPKLMGASLNLVSRMHEEREKAGTELSQESKLWRSSWEPEIVQPQQNVPKEIDLPSLRSKILQIISSDLSDKERIAKINEYRYLLPEKDRWDLDGKFYDLSIDKYKGGEGWADRNSAKDPSTLLVAIDELIK